MRSEIEVEDLPFIQAFLEEGVRNIHANQAERRFPGHTDTGRCPQGEALEYAVRARRVHDAIILERLSAFLNAAQGAKIGEAVVKAWSPTGLDPTVINWNNPLVPETGKKLP